MADKNAENRVTLSKDKTDGVLYLPDSKCRVLLKHDTRVDTPPGHSTLAETRVRADRSSDLTPDDPRQEHPRECLSLRVLVRKKCILSTLTWAWIMKVSRDGAKRAR